MPLQTLREGFDHSGSSRERRSTLILGMPSSDQLPYVYHAYDPADTEDPDQGQFDERLERRWRKLSSLPAFQRASRNETLHLEEWVHRRCNSKHGFFRLELEDLLRENDDIFREMFLLIKDTQVRPENVNRAYRRLKKEQREPRAWSPRAGNTKGEKESTCYQERPRNDTGPSSSNCHVLPVEEASICTPAEDENSEFSTEEAFCSFFTRDFRDLHWSTCEFYFQDNASRGLNSSGDSCVWL